MPWCPNCKTEYREGFTHCADCGAALVQTLPDEAPEPETLDRPAEAVMLMHCPSTRWRPTHTVALLQKLLHPLLCPAGYGRRKGVHRVLFDRRQHFCRKGPLGGSPRDRGRVPSRGAVEIDAEDRRRLLEEAESQPAPKLGKNNGFVIARTVVGLFLLYLFVMFLLFTTT